jgi:hypothetical protein
MKIKDDIKYYPVICCECGTEFHAAKSIGQKLGMDLDGCGRCPNPDCNTFLNLRFDLKSGVMISKKWDDYLAERRAKQHEH